MTTRGDIFEIPSRAKTGDWQQALYNARRARDVYLQHKDERVGYLLDDLEKVGLAWSDCLILAHACDILEKYEKWERKP